LAGLKDVKGPLIVVGDFNEEPKGNAYRLIKTHFIDTWTQLLYGSWLDGSEVRSQQPHQSLTYPADKPAKRIDYIFTRESDRIKTKRAWIVETLASDHLPVVADLEIQKAP
jgi:endonuclease/exonuclease/phosphatase family metal-dependent hydrolase